MPATADAIIERRRLRKRLAFWRILAILAILAVVVALVPWRAAKGGGAHVARIEINGVIVSDRDRQAALKRIAEDDDVKALIVSISSPGGTVVGSEALFDGLRAVAAEKPVVAVLGEVAASGGYVAAMGADRIFARRNTITGSIGVVSSVPDATRLLERLGVSFTEIKSSPLKAAPNPVSPHTPEQIAAMEALVLDAYGWFTGLVSERRGLEGPRLAEVADGRVFSGAQAAALGLVDALGDESAARDWLAETHDISAELRQRDYRWDKTDLPFPFGDIEERMRAWLPAAPVQFAPGPQLLAIWTG
ncbi:signal peptide peptidase SppA [Paralimibaculum aggregatum]|nr:signal peptide peptidase SppA [Limibaculum sp. NKW23]